ncbi:MAG: hypothetical protein SGCHY_001413 [Lobulomycetales sp.]
MDFRTAITVVRSNSSLPDSLMLRLYGLYKRATVGAPDPSQRPGLFDFRGRAKYDAWASTESFNQESAMQAYVDLVISDVVGGHSQSRGSDAEDVNCSESDSTVKESGISFQVSVSKMEHPKDDADSARLSKAMILARDGLFDELRTLLEGDDTMADEMCRRDPCTGMTALFFACDRGHYDIVRYLLERGANINERDSLGQTALHVAAAASGKGKLFDFLVHCGGDESIPDFDGVLPIDLI